MAIEKENSAEKDDLASKFQEIDLLITRVQQQSPGLEAFIANQGGTTQLRASSLSTLCCSLCVSTASTIHPDQRAIDEDPEAARALATLYDRAISNLGEDGFAEVLAQFGDSIPPDGLGDFITQIDRREDKK